MITPPGRRITSSSAARRWSSGGALARHRDPIHATAITIMFAVADRTPSSPPEEPRNAASPDSFEAEPPSLEPKRTPVSCAPFSSPPSDLFSTPEIRTPAKTVHVDPEHQICFRSNGARGRSDRNGMHQSGAAACHSQEHPRFYFVLSNFKLLQTCKNSRKRSTTPFRWILCLWKA
jgi:hypothetical protein